MKHLIFDYMKHLIFFTLISLVSLLTLQAQNIDSKYLIGDWNRLKKGEIKKSDTLIFTKDRVDSTFRFWKFKNTGDLHIASGYVDSNNKYWTTYESEHFRWIYNKPKNAITIKNDKKNESFRIIDLSESRLILIRND